MNSEMTAHDQSAASDELVNAVVGLSQEVKGVELACLRGIVCNVAQSLCPNGTYPTDPTELAHFKRAICMLAPMQGHARMTKNRVCFQGRPDFMSDDYLARLQNEARDIRHTRAIQQRGHLVGVGGQLGDELASSAPMLTLVESSAGPVSASGVVSYMFYEDEGAGLCAHVDTDIFSINVNIMLEHTSSDERSSHLFIFSTDGEQREEIQHQPGEIVITFGDSIVHGRAPLSRGESVTLLTVGFQPTDWT